MDSFSWIEAMKIDTYIRTSLVPRKIFGPKTDEVKGEWRRLHNEELYDM